MGRKILAFFVTVWLIATCATAASAETFDPGKTGSVSVTLVEREEKTPIVGAELSMYHIAAVGINTEGNLNYSFTEEYANLGIAMDDPALAAKLDAYFSENEMPAIRLCTNEKGTAGCQELPLGCISSGKRTRWRALRPAHRFLWPYRCKVQAALGTR